MKAVVQRSERACVLVDGQEVARIGKGLVVLLGVAESDSADEARWMAGKVANLRIFEDADGKMNRSILEVEGEVLAVSQFTLLGDARKGRRPSFVQAARPEFAKEIYEIFVEYLEQEGCPVKSGVFQAHMKVELVNDGPVTIILETPDATDGTL